MKTKLIYYSPFFVAEVTARIAADILGFQANPVALFYRKVRQVIVAKLPDIAPEQEEFEVNERYFEGVRKGKREREGAGKVPVFGILKRGGRVHIKMVLDTKFKTLFVAIRGKILPELVVYTDNY